MKFKKFTDSEKKQMAQDYADGDPLRLIAARYGVSIPTMAKYVRAGGGIVRKPGTVRNGNGDFVKTVQAVNDALANQVEVFNTNNTPLPGSEQTAPTRVLLSVD